MNVSPLVCTDDLKKSYKTGRYADESVAYFKKTLPLLPTVELAETAADLMTDGHIAVRDYYKSSLFAPEGQEENLRIRSEDTRQAILNKLCERNKI
ncbi:hypothetical protein J4441_01320 [Candidatus Micrarchaeota archaeon]|nr:hypothetical protein [Candidatus Micrarchaeota archaeon]